MIKCPNCGKQVQGKDLIGGICSYCNQRLTSDDKSSQSGDSKSVFIKQLRAPSSPSGSDPGSVDPEKYFANSNNGSGESDAGDDSSSATFLSDDFPDRTIESGIISANSESDVPSVDDDESISDTDLTMAEAVNRNEPQRPDTQLNSDADNDSGDIGATYISAEAPEENLDTIDGSGIQMEHQDEQKTIFIDDLHSDLPQQDPLEDHMKTLVVETNQFSREDGDQDQTYISDDIPEGMLKTVASLWGSLEDAVPGEPHSRTQASPTVPTEMKSGTQKKASLSKQQQTLVIKTKSFSDAIPSDSGVPRIREEDPEYELLKVLGEGGMGVVYDARQTSIDRNVAVKMLKAKSADNQKQRAKFLAEAVVTGELDHPNIVPIYDVGSNSEGALFYSMKKVQGTPWLKIIKQKSIPENLEILMKIADAVGFAHARGVVHRDLKPENVMLGEFGEVLVMDWGLAQPSKAFRKSRSIVETNTMGGTPAYMAPEMTTGPIERIGPASDVYLLGAMLFEILTGSPPHVAKNAMKCLMAAARNEITPTDKKGELVDIAMRAMQTNPEDRYQDVKSFQAAIRDYQSHSESVLLSTHASADLKTAAETQDYESFSRAVFGFQQAIELWDGNKGAIAGLADAKLSYAQSAFRKGDLDLSLSLIDKNNADHASLHAELLAAQKEREAKHRRLVLLRRVASGLAAAVFLIVVGATIWIRSEQMKALEEKDKAIVQENIAKTERGKAVVARDEAVKAKEEAEEAKVKEELAKEDAIKNEERAKTNEQLAKTNEKLAKAQQQKAEYEAYISKIGLAASQIDKNAFGAARDVLKSCKPELRNWEWGRLSYLCSQNKQEIDVVAPVDALAISNRGDLFATGGWNGTARIWDLTTKKEKLPPLKHDCDYVYAVAFSPDGKFLATGSDKIAKYAQLWDCETGKRTRVFEGHTKSVRSVAFSKDGKRLLTGSLDKTAALWDVETGKLLIEFKGHSLSVNSVAFSPDETQIVSTGQDGTAVVYQIDIFTQKITKTFPPFAGHKGPVNSATFSSDGKSVVSAGYDGKILIWKPELIERYDFRQLNKLSSTNKSAKSAPQSEAPPEVIPLAKFRSMEGHTGAVRSVKFSADGKLLVSGGLDATVRVWDFATGMPLTSFRNEDGKIRGHGEEVTAALFLPDGKRLLSASHDKSVREWNIDDYQELRTLRGLVLDGHADAVLDASFSPDRHHIVTASRDRTARTWNAGDGKVENEFTDGHSYLASSAVFFPDGRRLITAAVDNTTRLWDVDTGGQIVRFEQTGRSAAIALSTNQQWIATGGNDNLVQLWDVRKSWESRTGSRLKQFLGHTAEVNAIAFSPDDLLLATGDLKGNVLLWNIETREIIKRLKGHTRKITAIRFLKDGSRLVTSSIDNSVGQWDVSTGKEIEQLVLKHPDSVIAMQVIPELNQIVTSCTDKYIRIWDADKAEVIHTFSSLEGGVYSLSVSADGRQLIAADSKNRTVRFWDVVANREVQKPQANGQLGPIIDLKKRGGLLWSVAFQPGSDDILTVGGGEARLWETSTGNERMSFSQHGTVASACYSPDGNRIATGSWDNSAKVWDIVTKQVVRKFEGIHTGNVNSVAFSKDGTRLLTASDDHTAILWNIESGTVAHKLIGHTDRIWSATFSPDGNFIVTASNDKTARIWRADDGASVKVFSGHKYGVTCATFTPDGKTIITGSEDTTAGMWDVSTGDRLIEFRGHTARVTSVAASPDGTRILTGSADQSAKLWDADPKKSVDAKGKEILSLNRHTEEVTSVAFSSDDDGRQILTGSRDGTAVIWLSSEWKKMMTASE